MEPNRELIPGIYEQLLDEELGDLLAQHPEVSRTLAKLDDEGEPQAYSQFIAQIFAQAFRIAKPEHRLPLLNRIIELASSTDGLGYLKRRQLLSQPDRVLHEVGLLPTGQPRPDTPLHISSLLTGAGDDPQLERELRIEMQTADRVDILISFIKWSGLRLLIPAFEGLAQRKIPVRIITTSYMGASDPEAVAWLASQAGFSVRISYDTDRTRLHAKAYHFIRNSGYSTAYIGSANMSRAAMTSGLEWTVKVTAQDMPHVLARFEAEFETYWSRDEFVPFDTDQTNKLRKAIAYAKGSDHLPIQSFFADIRPRAFQERILEALEAARQGGSNRNLVVAATGTGKTVMAALDYARFARKAESHRLLFAVHRKEILHQAIQCFRAVLRDANFGELLVDGQVPNEWNHVFASIQSLSHRRPWESLGESHFDFVIVDEAHHGAASSYRPLFDHLAPKILLGLTATPERMDGTPILPDFDDRFAAEIRLPEALDEKLLCPFHYFGVTDPIDVSEDRFWKSGKYDPNALTEVYTGDDIRALQRLDLIIDSLRKYQPDLSATRAVGFCASVAHAKFMAEKFKLAGFKAEEVLGETPREVRDQRIRDFRSGNLTFLFTVDIFSEGVDIPEINLVLFLRPTESLTVFLQQLGRGLRHAPEKDCLTVLDFVGQVHRKYRIDRKFGALLRTQRRRIDQEVERDFPNLPPGCSIQLERVAREHVLRNIRESLGNLKHFIPESIQTFEEETGKPLNFGNFVDETGLDPLDILRNKTWSEWKALAGQIPQVRDPDLDSARKAFRRIVLRTDRSRLNQLVRISKARSVAELEQLPYGDSEKAALHYLIWAKKGSAIGATSYTESFARWTTNIRAQDDLREIAEWRRGVLDVPTYPIESSGEARLELHATYGLSEIAAAFGLANLESPGPKGVGVIPIGRLKTYIHLVTFKKEEKDFTPTTLYRDYPISRTQLHWESQAATAQETKTGQNYIAFKERGYTILFFARQTKRIRGETVPFLFLGPAKNLLNYHGDRPISMVWELQHLMPAAMFEEAKTA